MIIKQVQREYREHFLRIEAWLAILATCLFALWTENYGGWTTVEKTLAGNRGAVYGAFASLFGSLLGFVIAAVAIVLGYAESDRLKIVRESGHYGTLWRVFTAGMHALGFATITALGALILDRDNSRCHPALYACVWGVSLATARVIRSLWVLEQVIKIATKPRDL